MIDLAIVNGALVGPRVDGHEVPPQRATVLIHEGRIHAILDPGARVDAAEVLDAEGMFVLPGAIDIHFHCRAPAFPMRGDFTTETRAAAAGGVTTVFEMPVSKPTVATVAVWEQRRVLAERQAVVNVALYGSPGRLQAHEIEAMAAAGAIGFKLFLPPALKGREDEFEGLIASNMGAVVQALELIRPTGLRCVFHAEDPSLLAYYSARAAAGPGPDFRRHGQSRPPIVEATAVAALVVLADHLDAPVHIAHVSTKGAVELIRAARAGGAPVTAETCPHYLLFTDDILEVAGPYGKINPPIRSAEDRASLWAGLRDGVLDVIATDHAPYHPSEKEAGWENILRAPSGHPGVEALVPVVLTQALNGRLGLDEAIELISTRPAQLFDLYPRKGSLRPGADADITIYDPRLPRRIDRTQWVSRAAECNRLYDGMPVQGKVHATLVGGRPVFYDGRLLGKPGDGRVVRPNRARGAVVAPDAEIA